MRSASANTASMSCSIRRMVSSRLNARSVLTIRADSSGPMPAIGSSRSSMLGRVASAIAISSWRCSPWLRLATSTSARSARPTCARTARAGSRSAASRRALRQKRNEWPLCACTASATLSSAVKSGNSEVIWNERARPSALRRWMGSAVMSRPAKATRPESGAISPVSSPISVVLPAPFGPMTACSSPAGTLSVMSSDATTPPKRLVRPSIARSASVTTLAPQQSVDAAARIEHDQEEQRAQHDLPIFRDLHRHRLLHEWKRHRANDRRQELLEHQQRDRADQRAERRRHAAEHDHHDEIARARPVHGRRADEAGMVGEQRAGKAADRTGDDKARQSIAEGRETDRLHAPVVRARSLDHQAEARVHEPKDQIDRTDEQHEAQIVEDGAVGEIDQSRKLAAAVDGQAVVGTVALEPDAEIVDELREG